MWGMLDECEETKTETSTKGERTNKPATQPFIESYLLFMFVLHQFEMRECLMVLH